MRIHVRKVLAFSLPLFLLASCWFSKNIYRTEENAFEKAEAEHGLVNEMGRVGQSSANSSHHREAVVAKVSGNIHQLSSCLNGGSTGNWHGRTICSCPDGFMGQYCEEAMDEAHSKREKLWISAVKNAQRKNRQKRLPDAIGIGVEKCGTDALITFIRQHPLLQTPPIGETQFFNARYSKGISSYLNMMPLVTEDEMVMEKTPAYFNFLPWEIPFRIKKHLPNVKIILLVCDPVHRVYSDYVQEKTIGGIWDQMEFDNLIKIYMDKYNATIMNKWHSDSDLHEYVNQIHKKDKPSHILTTGMYYHHLLRWAAAFGLENIHILNGEDLVSQPGEEIEKLQSYLGLPKMLLASDFVRNESTGFFCFGPKWSENFKGSTGVRHHTRCLGKTKGRTRNKDRDVSAKSFNDLKKFYRPFNERFFKFIGRRMKWQ